jgi:hypothetical protein
MKYRVNLRGYKLSVIEEISRYNDERYFDTITGRYIVVGRHGKQLVMVPYERDDDDVIPVTVHATSREQINFRLKTGRFRYE